MHCTLVVYSYGHVICSLLLCLAAGIAWPTLPGALYTVAFLTAALALAMGARLDGAFGSLFRFWRIALIALALLQLLAIYIFQFQFLTEFLDADDPLPMYTSFPFLSFPFLPFPLLFLTRFSCI